MTDILFGQSYYLRFDPKLYQAMQPYPPLGTLYAASVMRQRGYEVALFDAMLAESETAWRQALDAHRPRFAVLYEDNFNYLSKLCLLNMRQAAFKMIGMAKERGCTVIVAGSDVTDHYPLYLQAGADFAIRGEGEVTLAELIEALTNGSEQVALIPGLAFKAEKSPAAPHFHVTPARPVMKAIDDLPFPAWDLVDVEKYRRIWTEQHGYYSMNMVTTRGCPYHCNWCAKPIWGQRYASRNPENVVREMKWLQETFRPDHIWFMDDIMGLKPGWWPVFADLVVRHDARVPFKCLSRADLIVADEKNVAALARAGCEIIWIGAESGSQKILNAMEKGITVEQIYQAAHRLHDAGVKVAFFLQFGYPGETRADIEKTLQMVRDCRPDDIGMSVSYPLPGTKFYENVKLQLGEKQNWTDSADLAMMYQGPFTTEFYRQLHVVLHKEFRSRRTWHIVKQVLLKPRQWRTHHFREMVASVYRLVTLPLARAKLNRLAAVPHEGLAPLEPITLAEAARPSPQD
jgi:anaerobic magnesium-protoporphyrin IX monomethyl ester cyclase